MKAIALQLDRLERVRGIVNSYLSQAQTDHDSIKEVNFQNASEDIEKVINFLSNMNITLQQVEPDLCPHCGIDLGKENPT